MIKSKKRKEESLADIAEKWWKEQGHRVPKDRRTKSWKNMYKKWHTYAFKDFR